MCKNTLLPVNTTLNCGGKLLDLTKPAIMGILNVTPDSFYDGGRYLSGQAYLHRAEQLLAEGASVIDIGGMSTRPGAGIISTDEELKRVMPVVEAVCQRFPDAIVSIDTVREQVATAAVQAGAGMVNDVSAGNLDAGLLPAVAKLQVPYVLMHMQGTPQTMQQNPQYQQVTEEVMQFIIAKLAFLRSLGITDIVLDPGLGFGKTVQQNYRLLKDLPVFALAGLPVLVGLSRKSMVCRVLGISPADALNGSTALHMLALLNGASLLRVHDVKEAKEVIALFDQYRTV
ncbi:dihydropteroate synthase [Sphingobacteriales bacterium UPWRP_1]|nr:dihydropteroate synthase [Sphingobacteriales bacterium TSM_CSS]PSJ77341.1 dihydropteroate synthase [Sphingobacteriales bacterium UPWRP_1]